MEEGAGARSPHPQSRHDCACGVPTVKALERIKSAVHRSALAAQVHEGSAVRVGKKYVIRTDVLYTLQPKQPAEAKGKQ